MSQFDKWWLHSFSLSPFSLSLALSHFFSLPLSPTFFLSFSLPLSLSLYCVTKLTKYGSQCWLTLLLLFLFLPFILLFFSFILLIFFFLSYSLFSLSLSPNGKCTDERMNTTQMESYECTIQLNNQTMMLMNGFSSSMFYSCLFLLLSFVSLFLCLSLSTEKIRKYKCIWKSMHS